MNTPITTQQLTLTPNDPQRLANLCGQFDEHLKQIESTLSIEIKNRGNVFQIKGQNNHATAANRLLNNLYSDAGAGEEITPNSLHIQLNELLMTLTEDINTETQTSETSPKETTVHLQSDSDILQDLSIITRKGSIKPRGDNQKDYVRNIFRHDINFGIGPAGTGKTYLAVACAVNALEAEEVRRILLVRPAVEAGEKLGFLPGDLAEKINPYLRPLYDALYEMLGFERVGKLIERQVIEVAPLAYMRGRTLNHAFIILDESQNTTKEQMKMFLTRIGFGSKAVITGDHTQIDLPKGQLSGLKHAMEVIDGVEGIGFSYFAAKDVVRHTLVQRIVEAYEAHDQKSGNTH
mgnify:CR=1 FL=1